MVVGQVEGPDRNGIEQTQVVELVLVPQQGMLQVFCADGVSGFERKFPFNNSLPGNFVADDENAIDNQNAIANAVCHSRFGQCVIRLLNSDHQYKSN